MSLNNVAVEARSLVDTEHPIDATDHTLDDPANNRSYRPSRTLSLARSALDAAGHPSTAAMGITAAAAAASKAEIKILRFIELSFCLDANNKTKGRSLFPELSRCSEGAIEKDLPQLNGSARRSETLAIVPV